MAERTQLSKSTVHRIWQAFGLEPHRQRHFKLFTNLFFVEKVCGIPGGQRGVLCVDEKIQALRSTLWFVRCRLELCPTLTLDPAASCHLTLRC
jgi:hypothetical protein